MLLFNIIQIVLLLLLGLATLYILLFSIASLFYRQKKYSDNGNLKKIAVLIPGYREDEVIIEVANAALHQDYPSTHYDVVIIADSFQEETISALKTLPIIVIEVSFEKSTKSKALNKAMATLERDYDIAVVLDADNVMAHDFLSKVNAAIEQGFVAVQGHRTAKNMNNSWAILDAISEEINNNIFRKGHRVLGLSSAIIGSGMAFQYHYFKTLMASATAVGGFDKEIELKMLKEGHTIVYLDDAVVFDEKIQKAEVFGNQRRRWLSAQLHYFRNDILTATKHLLLKGNVDYFDKAIQFIQPPRILLLGAVILCSVSFVMLNYWLDNQNSYSNYWVVLLIACVMSFVFSVPKSFYNRKTLKALMSLPKGMFMMLLSLLKIKGANKTFIHTKHGSTS
ncbi:Glycosyltransferase, catalytic subunit of cellulose synthase and poly-beta-1,6-N-acetylglucosamine synthase [Flavobacterium succinicans]|uniref:Glycosyltransferase, catalytic subunit of cellulose synthase and poly-beta-1,6-N-acetylglucosamine synthase n=1 Tax=Flavobacterium succinicans TaxID=29536 RepID=A0A1I4ZUW5_9FLAO|nr:glycosyltransferase family 2 protein [Flavobacterium succinicans]SFN54032.1 Glycosyltransferase, catalytic subunit of cellulose synthase and poly-beta-1,6-N-acetylglucosamine synthase [Flavobacterium succinicans]